jgi:hypothetical protein
MAMALNKPLCLDIARHLVKSVRSRCVVIVNETPVAVEQGIVIFAEIPAAAFDDSMLVTRDLMATVTAQMRGHFQAIGCSYSPAPPPMFDNDLHVICSVLDKDNVADLSMLLACGFAPCVKKSIFQHMASTARFAHHLPNNIQIADTIYQAEVINNIRWSALHSPETVLDSTVKNLFPEATRVYSGGGSEDEDTDDDCGMNEDEEIVELICYKDWAWDQFRCSNKPAAFNDSVIKRAKAWAARDHAVMPMWVVPDRGEVLAWSYVNGINSMIRTGMQSELRWV